MSAVRTIVAGVLHPASDDPALVAAAELARGCGAALHLVHAYELPQLHAIAHLETASRYADELRAALEAAAAAVPGAEGAACRAVHASPAHALLQVAEDTAADLLVVGAGRRTRFLGTTAQRVLRGAAVPVLVVRRPVRRPLERVLLATDLSELSAAAHEKGLDTAAELFGEPLAARSLLVVGRGSLPAPLPEEALARTARAELRLFLHARRPRPLRVEAAVRSGGPAEEIVAEADAWGADLLVLGTHGRVLLGSVAEACARDAACNVLAIPQCPEPAASGARIPERETAQAAAGLLPA